MLNEFALFEQMLALESIADQYTRGKACVAELDEMEERIRSRLYRVAVIGEFKRGKSSLVNAIIGAEVLPTDILPMTAAVTRVTYGAERRILIRFKDGREEEKSVAELQDYATKFDAEKEKTAATVREIVVHYPSVFCQNHIDIIDTPGLNDNESMTAVTLGVLGEVDAAMVVIAADKPLSLTEKRLILDLIGERQIRHLVFVVTCLDRASTRASDQDRVLNSIRTRLSGDVLRMAEERFGGEDFFLQKARAVLSAPDLFGVSSTLAIEGFVQDDWDLLEESRFPVFKNELLALLTAAQSMDMAARVKEAAELVSRELPGWKQADEDALTAEKTRLEEQIARLETFSTDPDSLLKSFLTPLSRQLSERNLLPEAMAEQLQADMLRVFIRQLDTIREANNTHAAIRAALLDGTEQAEACVRNMYEQSLQPLVSLMMQVTGEYGAARRALGYEGAPLAQQLKGWREKYQPPSFEWTRSPVAANMYLVNRDVIEDVQAAMEASLQVFVRDLTQYIASWRELLEDRSKQDAADTSPLQSARNALQQTEQQLLFLTMNHQQHERRLDQILAALGMQEDTP